MSKPYIHAVSSAKRYGGQPEDYIEIHNLMDSSKGTVADSRHRALTHTSWFLSVILERIFGVTFTNSDGKPVSVRDIGEQHVLEDFGGRFIPSVQDYFEGMEFQEWMLNGRAGTPSSYKKLDKRSDPSPVQPKVTPMDLPAKEFEPFKVSPLKVTDPVFFRPYVVD